MASPQFEQQAPRRRVDILRRVFQNKHLPGCYHSDLPITECICGGPEREMLLRALAEDEDSLG